jgi:hypothetical protein
MSKKAIGRAFFHAEINNSGIPLVHIYFSWENGPFLEDFDKYGQ